MARKDAEYYFEQGFAKAERKRYEEAIKDCDKAIEINPNYAKAYNNRGFAKADLQQYEEAIKDYDKAIEINPNYAKAYNNRSVAKQLKTIKEQTDIRAGIKEIKKLIKPYKKERNKTFLFDLIKKSTILAITISLIMIAIVSFEYFLVFKEEITGFRMMTMSISAFFISSPIVWVFVKMIQKEKDLDTILLNLREKKFLISWVNPDKPKELKQLQKYFMQNKASDLLTNNKTDHILPIQNIILAIIKAFKGK